MKPQKIVNTALKTTIALLIVHALIYPDLTQYQEKGMKYRIIAYPLGAFSIFIFNRINKIRNQSYPYKNDILLSTIITLDMLSNYLGFYGSLEWWDDFMHLINNGLITFLIFNIFKGYIKMPYVFLLTLGVISWLQISWEIAEYVTFVTTNSDEMPLAYRDTIGDLVYGQAGAIICCISLKFSPIFSRICRSILKT